MSLIRLLGLTLLLSLSSFALAGADGDGVPDDSDNCPSISNADQLDTDDDGYGDSCDPYPENSSLWSMKLEDALATIEDDQLRGCVANPDELSDLGAAVQVSDVIAIHCYPSVATLSGLENFTALEVLRIDDWISDPETGAVRPVVQFYKIARSEIADLTSISGLGKLRDLRLYNAKVQDLTPIAALTNLTVLNLSLVKASPPQLTDISPISGLVNLTELGLGNHAISELTSISHFANLQSLYIQNNDIRDLSALPQTSGFPGFRVLWIQGNPIENFSGLVGQDSGVFGMSVQDDAAYQFASTYSPYSIFAVFGDGQPPEDFDFLRDEISGFGLGCINCGFNDDAAALAAFVEKVSNQPRLKWLSLFDNELVDLSPLAKLDLAQSSSLDLLRNSVTNLWPLKDVNLSSIRAEDNPLLCTHIDEFVTQTGIPVDISSCLLDTDDEDLDGYLNVDDRFPANPAEWSDRDGDYIGDNSDDSDGDGYFDAEDVFPLDASETADSDNDGVGDNSDAFPDDATESLDSDCDSVGDNADNCPSLSNSDQLNTDGDSEGDACDSDDDNDGFTDDQEELDGTNPKSRFSCKSGCFSFDVDKNLEAQSLTDGLLVIRHLFGFSGDSLISGAVSSGASRDGSDAIASYLTDAVSELDIDGDGESKPLTDGLLLIRYLFGFSGDSLISGAIGSGAERDTAEEVEAYIEERVPAQ